MWTFRLIAAVMLVGAVAACSSGGSGGLSIDDLSKAGTTCPVRLTAGPSGHPTVSATASVEQPDATSPLAKVKGVAVDCGLAVQRDQRMDLTLIATRVRNTAVNLLLPEVAAAGDLVTTQLSAVGAAAARTKPGQLVPVPGDGPVALAVVAVRGADSAAFLLTGSEVPRSSVEAVARRLASSLA